MIDRRVGASARRPGDSEQALAQSLGVTEEQKDQRRASIQKDSDSVARRNSDERGARLSHNYETPQHRRRRLTSEIAGELCRNALHSGEVADVGTLDTTLRRA